jgi:hypothetical protein
MPRQRVLAPVIGAGTPQAAETRHRTGPPAGAHAGEIPVVMCAPARTCRYVQSLIEESTT